MNMKKKLICILFALGLTILTGCTVMRGDSTLPQYTNDAAITTAVKTKLVNTNHVAASRIHVETAQGVVLLSGFVKNQREANAAIHAAQSVNGVKHVDSYLVIK